MATCSPYSKEKTNHIRLCNLLVDIGRQVLQDVFDNICLPSPLHIVLSSNKRTLNNLRTKHILFKKQWDTLFPASGAVTSADFDITLLFLLLRNICNLRAPGTGWDRPPLVSDLSMEADLVRIKRCRNELCAHTINTAIPDKEFQTLWHNIETALLRLCGHGSKYQVQIQSFKNESLDSESEQSFKVLQQSWEEGSAKIDELHEKVDKGSAQTLDAIGELQEKVDKATISINGRVKVLTAGGLVVTWAAGSAYIVHRYIDEPETLIQLVQRAIIPSFVTGAFVIALLPGSFKILVEVRSLVALDEIWKSYIEGDMKKNLEKVIVTDDMRNLAPDDAENVDISLMISEDEYTKARDYLVLKTVKESQAMDPKKRLKNEVEQIAISPLAVRPILDALQPKILEVKQPLHKRWRTKVLFLCCNSPEVNYRLDCLHKFNEELINQKKANVSQAKKLEYIEDFDRFLTEDAQSRKSRDYPEPLDEGEDVFLRNTVVEAVVLRKFHGFVSVISFDGEEFPVKVKSTFPGLGIGLRVGDVLRVFKPKNDMNEQVPELVCCYHIELEDARRFLQNLNSSSTILEDFLRCHAVWEYILNELEKVTDDEQKRIECCESILQVCDKVNSLQFQLSTMTKQFWSSFKGSTFFNDVLPTVINKEPFVSDVMITSVRKFIENIIKVNPECAIKVYEILCRVKLQLSQDNMDFMYKFCQCLAVNVTGAKDDIDNLNWNQKPLIPASCELLTATDWKTLPKMKVRDVEKEKEGDDLAYFRYSSEEEYLRTNFTLLREECFFNLKNGIKQYLEKGELDCKSVQMYRIGFVKVGSDYRNQGLSFLLDYKHPKTNVEIDPDNSRWLMVGNLLCISFDSTFRSPIWGTVANRSQKDQEKLTKEKKVYVTFCTERNSLSDAEIIAKLQKLNDQGQKAYMFESNTFFVAFGPPMDVLQKKEHVPFKEQLVEVNPCIDQPPDYLKKMKIRPDWKIFFENPPNNTQECTHEQLLQEFEELRSDSDRTKPILDDKQLDAVGQALRNRVTLIEGPPGTGKSFVGVRLLQFLLDILPDDSGPILVATYKNFALDNLLEECLTNITDFKSKLIRVGGGGGKEGTSDDLESCKLFRLRGRRQEDTLEQEIECQLDAMKPEVQHCVKQLRCCKYSDIPYIFIKEADKKHIKSLIGDEFDEITKTSKNFRENKKLLDLIKGPLKMWLPKLADFHGQKQQEYDFRNANEKKCSASSSDTSDTEHEAEKDIDGAEKDIDGAEKDNHRAETDPSVESKERHNDLDPLDEGYCSLDDDDDERLNKEKEGMKNFLLLGECHSSFHNAFDDKLNPLDDSYISHDGDDEEESEDIRPGIPDQRLGNWKSILNADDIKQLKKQEKIQLVYALQKQYYKSVSDRFQCLAKDITMKYQTLKELKDKRDINVLKKRRVIGMTVSGAAIRASWLETIKPSVLIVEEAAEILEPQLLSIISSSVQHLIMIGDQKQLRPQVSHYQLGRVCKLDTSMFDRLVKGGLDCTQLSKQGRMPDDIADLVRKLDIYDMYETRQQKEIKCTLPDCLKKSMFFYTHKREEKQDYSNSKYNPYEAEKVIEFAKYLCDKMVEPSKITILCSYLAQVKHIKKLVAENYLYFAVSEIGVTTIDSFQGKENDIIILSLVRNSKKPQVTIGYLNSIKRICVAVSRARCGIYFFGNTELLARKSRKGWKKVIDHMKDKSCVGDLEKSFPFNIKDEETVEHDGPVRGPPSTPGQQNIAGSRTTVNICGGTVYMQVGDNNTMNKNTTDETTNQDSQQQTEVPPPVFSSTLPPSPDSAGVQEDEIPTAGAGVEEDVRLTAGRPVQEENTNLAIPVSDESLKIQPVQDTNPNKKDYLQD